MKNFIGLILGLVIISSAMFSSLIPMPFTNGNLTTAQNETLNDFYEIEAQSLSSQTKQKAISLDWFSNVNFMFENFVDTKIFDLKTGKTFVVQRTGGTGHADIEPTDEANAKILFDIIENTKITRRPMLALVGGTWVACSLWTKTHGYGLITNNNFDGHLCLHFLNSKTDSTKKVDYSHQKTIIQALKLSQHRFPK